MILIRPSVHEKASIVAYKEFAKRYNEGKKYSDRLRQPHTAAMGLLFGFYQTNLKRKNDRAAYHKMPMIGILNSSDPYTVTTNMIVAGKENDEIHARTAYRHFARLIEAGAIVKKFRGRERNLSFEINPYLIRIADNQHKTNQIIPDIEQAFAFAKMASCSPNIRDYTIKDINNKIINTKESNKFDELPNKIETGNGNTGSLANNFVGPTENNPLGIKIPEEILAEEKTKFVPVTNHQNRPKADRHHPDTTSTRLKIMKLSIDEPEEKGKTALNNYAAKIEKKNKEIKDLQHSYAILMIDTMLKYLNPEFKCWKSYFKTNADYVEKIYFSKYNTFKGLENAWSEYFDRLVGAKKYKEKHPKYTPFPCYYFEDNPTNKGFMNKIWIDRDRKYKKKVRNQKDNRKLMKCVRKFNNNPTQEVYDEQIKYLLENSHYDKNLASQFFAIVSHDYDGKLPNWKKKVA